MGICIRLQTLRHPVRWRDSSRSLARFPSLAFLPTVQFSRKWLSGFCSGPMAGHEDTGGDTHLIVTLNCVKEQEQRKGKVQPGLSSLALTQQMW